MKRKGRCVSVEVRKPEDLEHALRLLKRKLKREEAEKQRAKDFRKELRNASRSEFPWD